jgi:hypothetical protein
MQVTNNINGFIFRGYDIRGKYPEDLNEDVAYTIGKSYGTYIKRFNQTKCVIGHDNRYSNMELTKALVTGVLDTGIDVVYLDLVTTPMYYYTQIKLEIPAGVMVTASHNPKDENGFKFSFDERGNAKGEMIEEFRDFTLEGNYDDGLGTLSSYDIKDEYFELFRNSLDFGERRLKVVLDPGNGTTTCILLLIYIYFNIASARVPIAGRSLCFIVERMVTIGSMISSSFILPSISFITRPADGAHEPFSMIATRRRWYALSLRWSKKSYIGGKTSPSYEDAATTNLP